MTQESIRQNLLQQLARRILSVERDRAVVAIDGVDGSGKTTLADELADVMAAFGPNVVLVDNADLEAPRILREGARRSEV